jgi:carbon starvation protein CstA
MNKEEILEKSRQENRGGDERELQVKDKSMLWSYIIMILMVVIFSFIRSKQGLPMMDLSVTLCASVCAGMAYRFIKTKNKQYLIIAIIALIVAIIATVRFFMGH